MPNVNEEERHAHDGIAPGTVIDGRYKVIRSIGQGGNGLVQEVEHLLTGRRLALKSLIDETGLARLEQEARASSLMKNMHTAKITDMGTSGPLGPYMVMELLEGQSLRELLDDAGQLPLEITVNIALQVCECLTEAHGHGIVHRDLKPENIFLCASPWPGQYDVKVLDFGIVKISAIAGPIPQSSLTRTGSTVGTPYYMSLEQLRNSSAVDARADVYSLGVVLYECLSGRKPFLADTIGDLVYALCSGPPTHLNRLRPDLPADVCDILMRTLNMDRDERPANMLELATSLLSHGNQAFGLWMRPQSIPPSRQAAPPQGSSPFQGAAKEKALATPSQGSGGAAKASALPPKRSPMPSPTSTEFAVPEELDEITNATSSAAAALAKTERPPDSDFESELEKSSQTATLQRPRPQRPVIDSEPSSRDTPTEMYVKDGVSEKEPVPPRVALRDMPAKPVGGPQDRPFVETLPTPFSPSDAKIEPGARAQGKPVNMTGAPSTDDSISMIPSDGAWAQHRGSAPSIPTLTPRGLMQNSAFGSSPNLLGQPNPFNSTIPMPTLDLPQSLEAASQASAPASLASIPSPTKPEWQMVLDRALVNTGNFIEDKGRRFRGLPKQTQLLISLAASGVGLVLLSLVIFWLIFR